MLGSRENAAFSLQTKPFHTRSEGSFNCSVFTNVSERAAMLFPFLASIKTGHSYFLSGMPAENVGIR